MKIDKRKVITATAVTATIISTAIQSNIVMNKNAEINKLTENNLEYRELIEENKKQLKENTELIKDKIEEIENLKNSVEDLKSENDKLKKELSKVRNFEITYYTSLPVENGGYTTTASQTELRHGVIASNHYPIGTKIQLGNDVYTVEDTGGSEFDSPHRLDVLIERKAGESDDEYLERVNDMGRKQVKGKILS